MSEQPLALRLADFLKTQGLNPGSAVRVEAAAELRRQHDEIEQLKAERDALKVEVERLKGVGYDLIGQLMVLRATKQMTAAIDAARNGQ